jgi:hypothetical protein
MNTAFPERLSYTKRYIFMFGFIIVAGLGWTGYWFWIKGQVLGYLNDRIAVERNMGWQVEWSDLNVSGFPFQVRLVGQNIKIMKSDPAVVCQIPRSAAIARPWDFKHIILNWEGGIECTYKMLGGIKLISNTGNASVRLNQDLSLRRTVWDLKDMRLLLSNLDIAIETAQIHLAREDLNIHLYLNIMDTTSPIWASFWPHKLDSFIVDMTVSDQGFFETLRSAELIIHLVESQSAGTRLSISGDAKSDANGFVNGKATLSIFDFEQALEALNKVNPSLGMALSVLEMLSGRSANDDDETPLEIQVEIEQNKVRVAGISIATFPQLH